MDSQTAITLVQGVGALAVAGICYYYKNIPMAKKTVLALVVEAEQTFGSGTGDIKYTYVSGFIYSKLPAVVRTFISEKTVDGWIEEGVEMLNAKLEASTDTTTEATTEVTAEATAEVASDAQTTPVATTVEATPVETTEQATATESTKSQTGTAQ